MRIYFFRHALAEDNAAGRLVDAERQLTPRGNARTAQAARFLAALGVRPGVLYSSPLVRARDTAAILGKQLGLEVKETPELAPGCNVNALERLVLGLNEDAEVIIVGHEPDFSSTIAALTGGGRVEMKKGGLARVDILATDPLRGSLAWLLTPSIMDLTVRE